MTAEKSRESQARAKECYTCKREGRVLKSIIREYELGFVSFDLIGRPLYIYTPWEHLEDMLELEPEQLKGYYKEMLEFCKEQGVSGFQIMMNFGSWITHKQRHLHFKIAADESTIVAHKRVHMARGGSGAPRAPQRPQAWRPPPEGA